MSTQNQEQNSKTLETEKPHPSFNQSRQYSSPLSPASPPSSSSSPSHEFSFTISLHSSSSTTTTTTIPDNKYPKIQHNNFNNNNSFAVDLSPADEIFFHGHLLPLHLLSHLPASPRSSTNSLDSFTLPITDFLHEYEEPIITDDYTIKFSPKSQSNSDIINTDNTIGPEIRSNKSKSFSLFGLKKGRKGSHKAVGDEGEEYKAVKNKRKLVQGFDVIKRYARMVRPLLFFKERRDKVRVSRQAYSFSGNLTSHKKETREMKRGEFSAPASMRTSPANSGLLVAGNNFSCLRTTAPTSESTMEELQAAIQAAIAHCKNSIAKDQEIKLKSC